jgi:hypothetical protein
MCAEVGVGCDNDPTLGERDLQNRGVLGVGQTAIANVLSVVAGP